MEIGARREAERAMGKRDREEAAISGRMSRSLLYGMSWQLCPVLLSVVVAFPLTCSYCTVEVVS